MTDRPSIPHRVAKLEDAARYANRHPRTLRRYLDDGRLKPWEVEGQRGYWIDLDEIDSLAERFPRTEVRPSFGRLGPNAQPIGRLPRRAEVVDARLPKSETER